MKILILNWRDIKNPESGGAEIVTMEHAKAWIKNGHSVTWLASAFKDSAKEEIINSVRIVRRGNWITVFLLAPFFYFFSKQKYDLVIDEIHGIPFFTPLYVRKPKIAFIHEVASNIWDYMYPFPINKIGKITERLDRKSTRLNSSHQIISYAVFCLKKKKKKKQKYNQT